MAHWIIEDKGFGGQVYTCSNCKECYSDLFDNPYVWDVCKNCGEPVDEEEEEYIEDIKNTFQKLADNIPSVIKERYEAEKDYVNLKEIEQNVIRLFDLMTDKDNPIWLWLPDNAAMLQFAKYLNDNNVKVLEND